jgi:flagellar basal-body rod protein FlgF
MSNALLVGLSRQVALARELDVIANNVANVSTNGFKARNAHFREFVMPGASADGLPRGNRQVSFVAEAGVPLDLAPGAIERTGNPLDAAISGDAFFAVQTPAGERYTRNGAFQVGPGGQLLTSDGHAVLGDNGPIVFGPEDSDPSIAPDGTVQSAQGLRGRIRLVRFADPATLRNEGANLFAAAAPPQAATTSRIEAGAIERSNVKPILEMARLMDVSRAYTTLSGALNRLDELRRGTIQRLADAAA